MTHNLKSATCGELRASDSGNLVALAGWVNRRRDHGGLIFIDVRDRSGIVQLVFHPEHAPAAPEKAHQLRPEYVISAAGAASALAGSRFAFAQGSVPLPESDPQAQALGYKADATKADKAKFPKYAADQMCGNCQLYQGKQTDTTGPCSIFPNKLVASKGWCSAWIKKT